MGKIKLQKMVGNLFDKLRKLDLNGTVIWKLLAFPKLSKILGKFCFSEQIFHRKQSLGDSVYFEEDIKQISLGSTNNLTIFW